MNDGMSNAGEGTTAATHAGQSKQGSGVKAAKVVGAAVDLTAHMKRIRGLVKPENCARPSRLARKAARVRWDAVRGKKMAQVIGA
jgi:hypothetical protein